MSKRDAQEQGTQEALDAVWQLLARAESMVTGYETGRYGPKADRLSEHRWTARRDALRAAYDAIMEG